MFLTNFTIVFIPQNCCVGRFLTSSALIMVQTERDAYVRNVCVPWPSSKLESQQWFQTAAWSQLQCTRYAVLLTSCADPVWPLAVRRCQTTTGCRWRQLSVTRRTTTSRQMRHYTPHRTGSRARAALPPPSTVPAPSARPGQSVVTLWQSTDLCVQRPSNASDINLCTAIGI